MIDVPGRAADRRARRTGAAPRSGRARLFAARLVLLAPIVFAASAHAQLSLRFFGHGVNDVDRVKIAIDGPARPADVGATDFTLEWWMKAALADNGAGVCSPGEDNWITGNIMFDRDVFGAGDFGDYGVSLRNGRIAFGVADDGGSFDSNGICGSTNVADGAWHHVAVTRDAGSGDLRIFVDGQTDGSGSGPLGDVSYRDGRDTDFDADPFLVIGAEKHDAGAAFPSYDGFVDEIRLSTNVRYTASFTSPSVPFTTDGATAALYHFDEGPAGSCTSTVLDSSGASGGPSHGACSFGGSAPAGPVYASDTPFSGPAATPTGPTPTPTLSPTPTPTPTATQTLTPTPVCGATPEAGCRTPAVPQKSSLLYKDNPPPADKDVLLWKWNKGSVTPKADFGNPLAGSVYQLCIYDGTTLISSATAPAAGTCNAANPRPCWKESTTGFKYADRDATPTGLTTLLLKEGLVAGKAKITVKGKGGLLDTPAIPLAQPVTVQLKNSDGACWEAVYGAPAAKNTAGPPAQFKDKSD